MKNRTIRRLFSLIFAAAALSLPSFGQLTVQSGFSAQQLAEHLAGPNITVSNATLTGPSQAAGKFVANNTNLGMNSGVLLSSGNLQGAIGPNNNQGQSMDFGAPGSALLDPIAGAQTYDAITLAFDFTVESDEISFNYVFASEEYPEFVNAGFNDVFGFFISGPGISGQQNIALVPGTTVATSINNINSGSYWQYYVDNDNGTTIEYDGFTTNLVAHRDNLIPCSTYRLTLVIADAGDGIFDSGVFLEENSLVQGTVSAVTNTPSGDSIAVEGCLDAHFTFNINQPLPYDLTIPLGIGGTAINGVDYTYIDSLIVIPAGQTSASIIVHAAADGITEGMESVLVSFQTSPCGTYDTVRLYITDNVSITYGTNGNNPTCAGASNGSIVLNMTGGTPPFTVVVNGTDTIVGTTIPNLPAGTYVIDVLDGNGCGAEDLVIGGQYNAGTTFLPDGHGAIYTSDINIAGFPPGSTLTNVNMLNFVCLNMEHSFMGDLEIRLYAPNGTYITLKERPGGGVCNLGEPVAVGNADANSNDITPGIGYDYCFTNNPLYGTMVSESNNYTYTYTTQVGTVQTDRYLPAGSYEPYQAFSGLLGVPLNGNWQIWIKDHRPNDNGYLFNWSISLTSGQTGDTVVLVDPPPMGLTATITAAGCGANNGGVNISVSGSTSYSYAWSNGPSTQDINNVQAGTYTVTVTGANGCQRDSTFIVPNSGTPPNVTATPINVTCPGGTNGGATLSVSGGTAPYSYLWSNGSTSPNLSNVPANTYFVTVTGANSCRRIVQVVVGEIPGMTATASITDETCGNQNGIIDLTVSGGTGPYSYHWNNNATTQDRNFLAAGSYSVTITDASGCTLVRSYSIVNYVGNCIIPCNLSLGSPQLTQETCGNANGAIVPMVNGGTQPYSYSWSNGSSATSLSNLAAGTYSVTVIDVNNCSATGTYSIQNLSGTLAVSGQNLTHEICGNDQGSVDLSVSGGTQPYQYLWSNGATTQDISGLVAGTYSVTVTDGSGCHVNSSATIQNQTNGLTQTYGNAMSGTCGGAFALGSIDITMGGGNPPYSYAWSNGATTEDLLNLANGTYTCTVTDASGCQFTTPSYLIQNGGSSLTLSIVLQVDEICGNGQGRIKVTGANGSTPYTYLWNTGATTNDLTGLSAGTYSVTVTGANGCSASSGLITLQNSSGTLNPGTMFIVNEVCGNHQGYIRVNPSGGEIPYAYLWNTGSTSNDLNGVAAGTYSCQITDGNGCVATSVGTVSNDPGTLSVQNLVVTDETCGDGSGAVNLMISGGTVPLTYAWSNGATTEDQSGLHSGTYSVTITDNVGCTVQSAGTIYNQANGLAVAQTATAPSCGANNGMVDLTVTGGTGPYSYNWSNGTTNQDALILGPGTYFCTVTDAANCSHVAGPFVLTMTSGSLQTTLNQVVDETCTNGAGGISITVSGASTTPTFLWSNGATTQNINGLSAGVYTVTVTSAGCVSTQSATISNNPGTLSISPTISDEQCGNQAGGITLAVTGNSGNMTYAWSNGATTQNLSGVGAGSYSVTATDASGCQSVLQNLQVSNNPGSLSLTSFLVTDESCGNAQGSIVMNLSGGSNPVTYLWSNGATTRDISNLASGNYSVTITDASGCQLVVSGAVTNDPGNLVISSAVVSDATCGNANGGVDVTPAGGSGTYTYLWSNGSTNQDLSGVAAGTYTLLLSDNVGCSTSASVTVQDPGSTLVINGTSIQPAVCGNNAGSVSLNVTGGTTPLTYLWSNGATTSSISGLYSGTYLVTITDANGCTETGSATVPNSPGSLTSTLTPTDATCGNPNGSILLNHSGGLPVYSYLWSNGATTQNLSGLNAGTYSVTLTDGQGCSATSSTTIGNSSTMTLSSSNITHETCGNGVGAITLSVSGGAPGYTYLWSNGATTQNISNLHAGTYSVTITDAVGCDFFPAPFVVLNQTGTLQAAGQTQPETCGAQDGSVSLTVVGGSAPYSYLWSNGATSPNLSGLSAGNFSVTITDGSGCQLSQSFVVASSNGTLNVVGNPTHPDCNSNNGFIALSVNGGTPGYSFVWSTGSTAQNLTNLGAGTYTVTVTDAAGCESILSFNLVNLSLNLSWDITVWDDWCGNGSGGIWVDILSPGNYTFSMDGSPATGNNFFNAATGSHTITVYDQNGCSRDTTVIVPGQAPPNINANIVDATCASCADGDIWLTITNGNPPYSFQWSNGSFAQNLLNVVPGTYWVDITDANGCLYTMQYTISFSTQTQDPTPGYSLLVFPNPNNGTFQVELGLPEDSDVRIEIANLFGQTVHTESLGTVHSASRSFALSDLPDGIYMVRIFAGETRISKPVTIQR